MAIVQLELFDLLTANTARLMGTTGFWASLTRLTRDNGGTARLLMVADNLRPEEVLARFDQQAVPLTDLPPALRWYRVQYEEFLQSTVQVTRHMRLYLIMNSQSNDLALARLLGTYGIAARPLASEGVPLPFVRGEVQWNRVVDTQGYHWALVQSKTQQSGVIHPRSFHNLFAQDFPVWCALDMATMTTQQATQMLRIKDTAARYEKSPTTEAQQSAQEVRDTVGQMLAELSRLGAALHQVRFSVLVGGENESELDQRLEIVRSSAGLEMQDYKARGKAILDMFSAEPPSRVDGSLLPSHGLALLTSSAMSYRRRTETQGIFLGVDRNQAPVILDLFDSRNESYNSVILGITGSGKTFFTLLLMLRHLLKGVRLIVIDPQGNVDLSWLGADLYSKAVLGTTEASINILDITHDELAQQVSNVMAMLSMLQVVDRDNRLEVGLLDRILMDIYEPLWGRVGPTQVPTLQAVQDRLNFYAEDDQLEEELQRTARHLSFVLDQYTNGSRYDLFGQRTTVDFRLEHAVTVFDVSKLPKRGAKHDNLRAALLAILVGGINQSIRRKRYQENDWTPTLLLIDEMGILMRDPVIASHISEEFKTARARHVGVVTIDQDLHSYLGPADETGLHHGIPMLANRANTFIFSQQSSELARIREYFPNLPETMIQNLPNQAQGSCIAEVSRDLLLLNVLPSAFEMAALSSKATDRARAQELIQQVLHETRQRAA